MQSEKALTGTFKEGDVVLLIDDKYNEEFIVVCKTDKISKGPVRQLNPSPVYKLVDRKNRSWEFREDSLKLK